MIRVGTIPIRDHASVREARSKIRAVVEEFAGDPVESARLATATSEIAHRYLLEGKAARVVVAFGLQKGATFLLLDFADADAVPDVHDLAGFFDQIDPPVQSGSDVIVRAMARMSDEEHISEAMIEMARAIVGKKSRDVLLDEIQGKNRELQQSLDNLRRTRSAKERMESELNIGREIQMSMLPLAFPAFPERTDFDVYAALHPAREVGGDFYDLFLIDENHFCFSVGDVSGKGVPAALFMAVTKTLIKSRAANDLSPASILSHVNTELSQRNDASMFVTVFLAILNLRDGTMIYGNAGHNPPYLRRSGGDLVRLDQRHGPVIGAAEGIAYREDRTSLGTGDLLFAYTDGVTEAMNVAKELYNEERLKAVLGDYPDANAEEVVRVIVEDVRAFEGDAEQADDVTVLGVLYEGQSGEAADNRMELTIANRQEEIGKVNQQVSDFTERHGIDAKSRRTLNLVFDELLTNIIAYGYEDSEEHRITVTVSLVGDCLHVTIMDDGIPFNPFEEAPPADTGLSVKDRPIGGLGVHLVKNVMDRVAYERRGASNVVTLEKQIKPVEE